MSKYIVVICTANICRSPMGEALVRQQAQAHGYHDWVVESAGTWAEDGQRAAPNSVAAMAARQLDITNHRSRQVTADMLDKADLVLAMTRSHLEGLQAEFPKSAAKMHLFSMLRNFKYDVADPYGKPASYYIACADELADLAKRGWGKLCGWVGTPSENA